MAIKIRALFPLAHSGLAGGQWPLKYVPPFLLGHSGLAGGQWPLRYVPPFLLVTLSSSRWQFAVFLAVTRFLVDVFL